MPEQPPLRLASLLDELGLIQPGQLESVASIAKRLAGGLPLFDAVWVDALVEARLVTPFQAQEINSDRAAELAVGPYVLLDRIGSLGYASCYLARHRQTGTTARLVVAHAPQADAPATAERLSCTSSAALGVHHRWLDLLQAAGHDGDRVWAAYSATAVQTVDRWLVQYGRLPAECVLQIARQMASALLELERHDLVHGDIRAASLVMRDDRTLVLSHTGVHAHLRPCEGYALDDLPPQTYDGVAPERITHAAPISTATELFACGALWWHLLAGRPPFAGGDALAKLRSIHRGRFEAIDAVAPDAPAVLIAAITGCLAYNPAQRPSSISLLAQQLGPPTREGAEALARYLGNPDLQLAHRRPVAREGKLRRRSRAALTTACLAAVLSSVFFAPAWLRSMRSRVLTQNSPVATKEHAGKAPRKPDEKSTTGVKQQEAGFTDSKVLPASYTAAEATPPPILLPVGRVLRLETLRLKDSQTLTGPPGTRPMVEVPSGGLAINAQRVRVENIDFVSGREGSSESEPPAMLQVNSNRVDFIGCSFRCREGIGNARTAIAWREAAADGGVAAGELTFTRCYARELAAFVEVRRSLASKLTVKNTLHLHAGPLLSVRSPMIANEPLSLSLERVTVRGHSSVIGLAQMADQKWSSAIMISAVDCVFAPDDGLPLVIVAVEGEATPISSPAVVARSQDATTMLQSIQWSGQGSLVSTGVPFAGWQADGQLRPLPDENLSVAGLVRSRMKFAGLEGGPPSQSRILDWQAPLQSAEPPGIEPSLVEDYEPVNP